MPHGGQVIKTEVILRTESGSVKVSELIKYAEKLKKMFPLDQEYFYVKVTASELTAYDEEEH